MRMINMLKKFWAEWVATLKDWKLEPTLVERDEIRGKVSVDEGGPLVKMWRHGYQVATLDLATSVEELRRELKVARVSEEEGEKFLDLLLHEAFKSALEAWADLSTLVSQLAPRFGFAPSGGQIPDEFYSPRGAAELLGAWVRGEEYGPSPSAWARARDRQEVLLGLPHGSLREPLYLEGRAEGVFFYEPFARRLSSPEFPATLTLQEAVQLLRDLASGRLDKAREAAFAAYEEMAERAIAAAARVLGIPGECRGLPRIVKAVLDVLTPLQLEEGVELPGTQAAILVSLGKRYVVVDRRAVYELHPLPDGRLLAHPHIIRGLVALVDLELALEVDDELNS